MYMSLSPSSKKKNFNHPALFVSELEHETESMKVVPLLGNI